MNFGEALEKVKEGHHIFRTGWNSTDQWVFYEKSYDLRCGNVLYEFQPFLIMRTVRKEFIPWVCSQSDILADDWEIQEPEKDGE